MTDDEIRSLFREMRQEVVPADALARVRLAVAERTRQAHVRRWRIPLLIAACCGIAMLCAVLFRPAVPMPPALPPITARQLPVEVPAPAVAQAPKTRRVVRQVHRAPPRRLPQTVVRIETNDPNVVILLVGE